MAKGDFSNLKGSGKPLQFQNHNPYIDIATHKINQVFNTIYTGLNEKVLHLLLFVV